MGQTRSHNVLAALAGVTMTIGTLALSSGVASAHEHGERDDDRPAVTFTKASGVVPFSLILGGGGGTLSCNENVNPYDTITCIDPYYGTNQIYIDTTNYSSSVIGHIEFVGPGIDQNTSNATYRAHSYVANGSFGSGTYCANFWKYNGNGSYSLLNTSCGSIV